MENLGYGDQVRKLRKQAKLTQDELARKSGLSSVKMIEAGRRGSLKSLEKIAAALTVELGRPVTIVELLERRA